ncbi:MAG: hypothetical protein GF399_09245 [Candidatus Coatesbacteria bacterium]|nr:hypothetical protein [Candidatus Coatesbacteria bacterium]
MLKRSLMLLLLPVLVLGVESYQARRLDCPPELDGDLDEACWENAEPLEGYIQRDPDTGEPSTETTRLYIGYTEYALYVAIESLDSEPTGIVSNLRRRDTSLGMDDNVDIWFDPTGSGQSLYYFGTNPAGIKADVLYSNRANYRSQQWDAHWDVATRITDEGWTAELEIPFSNFKFEEDPGRPWLFNAGRVIRRKSEETYVVPVPYDHNMFYVEDALELTGIENITQGVGVKLAPYAKGEYRNLPETGNGDIDDWKGIGGLDFDVDLGRSLTLAGTVLPDFAEIDLDPDQYQIGLDPVYVTETRPFFLRDSTYFNFIHYTPFYSRRIGQRLFTSEGLYEDSQILAGGRLTGRLGRFGVGGFYAHTGEAVTDLDAEPESDWAVGRLSYELGQGSFIGAMGTARFARSVETDWDTVLPAYDYATYGADFDLYFADGLWNTWGSVVGSYDSRDPENTFEDQFAINGGVSFSKGNFSNYIEYSDNAPQFDINETGFFWGIPNARSFIYSAEYKLRFDQSFLRNLRFWGKANLTYGRDWEPAFAQYDMQVGTTTNFLWNFTVQGSVGYDNLYYNPGEKDLWWYTQFNVESDFAKPIWLGNFALYGQMVDYTTMGYGDLLADTAILIIQPIPSLRLSAEYNFYDWSFGPAEGVEDYQINIWQATADYLFTRELYFRLFTQGSDQNDLYTFRGLLGWEFLPDSHVYLAYERWYDNDADEFELVNQGVFLKVDYTLQF